MVAFALAALAFASSSYAAPPRPVGTGGGLTPVVPSPTQHLTEQQATRIALAYPKVRAWLGRYPPNPLTEAAFSAATSSWTVKAWSGKAGEVALVSVDDMTGQVLEAWTGPQVAWKMARGYAGSFGGKTLDKLWVWLAFCLVFLLGLADLRKPISLRNLDLVALLAFSVSLAFFNLGRIFWSVPLVYPVLLYLLGRATWVGVRGRGLALRPVWPAWALVGAAVFLAGFRIGLNHESPHGVIDVGYAGVIGASRILHGEAPYGHMPVTQDLKPCGPADSDGYVADHIQTNGRCETANEHGDTYGPVSYLAYIPATLVFGWSGKWDTLPAAHATSVLFDLLTILGLVLVGLRFGGLPLAATLAFAWTAYPFTAYALDSNTNDTVMPALLVFGFWLVSSSWARGAAVALAGWTKFAALLVAPLWAGYPSWTRRSVLRFTAAFVAATVAAFAVLLLEPDLWHALGTFWHRTVGDQIVRQSPFSIWGWGSYHARGIPDLAPVQHVLEPLVVAFALVVAFVPRRKGPIELAALTAAVFLAFQLVLTHWFYLYLPWAFPFVALWLFLPQSQAGYQSSESTTGYEALESMQSAAKSAAPMSPVQSE